MQGELYESNIIAPFDIGSTNPKTAHRVADLLYAYAYTHVDKKTAVPNPRVVSFNINNFLSMEPNGNTFDETELCDLHLQAANYDYRVFNFALLPGRDWFN